MKKAETEALLDDIAVVVKAYVAEALAPVLARLDAVEKAVAGPEEIEGAAASEALQRALKAGGGRVPR